VTIRLKLPLAFLLVLMLSACSSTLYHRVVNIPAWILAPDVEGGIAVSECVTWSGDFAKDKAAAAAKSKSRLNLILTDRFERLERYYQSKYSDLDVNRSFNNYIQPVLADNAEKAKVVRVDFAEMEESESLCTMVHMKQLDFEQVFSQVIVASSRKIDVQQRQELLARFTSEKSG